ncbi:unnamed protein product [marine sediment metagenome]|uniref:Uncharacterized protein n=1 Tax=marine sediment metagenome TaxID=412755 RepID=X1CJJ9_9ZZZZ
MKVTGEIFSYLEKEPKRQKNGVVSGIEVKGADYFNWDSIERMCYLVGLLGKNDLLPGLGHLAISF